MDSRTGLPVVGMVGGGQLARMTHQAAIALGQSLRILAASTEDGAALVATDTVIGHPADLAALRAFAAGCDVVTFDHEHVPADHVRALAAAGITVYPGADALQLAQNKRLMRERLTAMGVPVPAWRPVSSLDDIVDFAAGLAGATTGRPAETNAPPGALEPPLGGVVAKAVSGGYDGRGVWFLTRLEEAQQLLDQGIELLVEERVRLRRELSAMVGRSPFGQVATYPVVQTVQRTGICVEVLAPVPGLSRDLTNQAHRLAIRIATELDVVGILAVELFEADGGQIMVNELAMRPHNSGHWTIEGSRTSQFEQHLRAVLDYPLGQTGLTAPAVATANVLGGQLVGDRPDGPSNQMSIDERLHHLFAADPGARVHLYGKKVRPGRKIGHVTVLDDNLARARARAARAARWLREGIGDQQPEPAHG